jgi:hypothetical protein
MDYTGRELSLGFNIGLDVCYGTPLNKKLIAYVLPPQLMREIYFGCSQFEAHRAESEIARVQSSHARETIRST